MLLHTLVNNKVLLAASFTDAEGKEHVEVLDCPWAKPGTPVVLEGSDPSAVKETEIDADTFFSVEISVKDKNVGIQGKPLFADGKSITTILTENGEVG